MTSARIGFLLATALFTAAGCGASRRTNYLTETPAAAVQPAAEQAGDLASRAEQAWQGREEVARLREAIALWEQMAAAEPANREPLVRLTRAYYLLGNGHLSGDAEILAAFDRGAALGEQALALNPDFKKRIAEGAPDVSALAVTSKEDQAAVYWVYSNLGKWSVRKGFTTVLKYKNKLKAFVDRVAEVDPGYFHGAADRGLGAYFAKAPSFAGGDLDKAEKHFLESLRLAPDYLGTKVLMAEFLATKRQDRAMFKRLLDEVLSADPAVIPEIVPEQKAEQRNAADLLARADDLFE